MHTTDIIWASKLPLEPNPDFGSTYIGESLNIKAKFEVIPYFDGYVTNQYYQ